MKQSADKMAALTAALLAYARGGKYRTRTHVFSELIKSVFEQVRHEVPEEIDLKIDFFLEDYTVKADKILIRRMLRAILANAAEAVGESGKIHIVCQKENPDPRQFKQVQNLVPGEYLCLTIMDDGAGMVQSVLDNIFEPFFTTRFPGRGLGMSAVYGIVKSHEGYIRVDSALEKGTTVKVYFPIQDLRQPEPGTSAPPEPNLPLTILLVEDKDDVRAVTRRMLEKLGHRVLQAASGRAAVEKA